MSKTTHSGNPSRIQAPHPTRKPFQRAILIVHTVFGHIYFSSGHAKNPLFLPILPLRHIRTDSFKIKGVQQ